MLWLGTNLRVVKQYERGVVFRFGRVQTGVRAPGLTMLIPIADRLEKVNMQIITMPIPAQDGITRDNVTVRVDAVIYFNVADPVRAAVDVQDYTSAIGQVAQTSLRSIIGKSDLDDLLSNREGLNQGMELMIDSPALGWGVHIDRVEIKDVVLPDSMKRSMSRQAEAERERRARIITADGELQASEKLAQAAEVMSEHPAALQLRLLQTVVEVAAEKNSTLVLPFPVELLRFLEKATPQPGAQNTADTTPDRPCPMARHRMRSPHQSSTTLAICPSNTVAGQPFRLKSDISSPDWPSRQDPAKTHPAVLCTPTGRAAARRGHTVNYEHSNHVVRLARRTSETDIRVGRPLHGPGRGCRNAVLVWGLLWVNGCKSGTGDEALAQCGGVQRNLLGIGSPLILLLGGLAAFVRTYQVWRARGRWWIWQGAGWFLLLLMLVVLTMTVPVALH